MKTAKEQKREAQPTKKKSKKLVINLKFMG